MHVILRLEQKKGKNCMIAGPVFFMLRQYSLNTFVELVHRQNQQGFPSFIHHFSFNRLSHLCFAQEGEVYISLTTLRRRLCP